MEQVGVLHPRHFINKDVVRLCREIDYRNGRTKEVAEDLFKIAGPHRDASLYVIKSLQDSVEWIENFRKKGGAISTDQWQITLETLVVFSAAQPYEPDVSWPGILHAIACFACAAHRDDLSAHFGQTLANYWKAEIVAARPDLAPQFDEAISNQRRHMEISQTFPIGPRSWMDSYWRPG